MNAWDVYLAEGVRLVVGAVLACVIGGGGYSLAEYSVLFGMSCGSWDCVSVADCSGSV